jgi:hypothetical protein
VRRRAVNAQIVLASAGVLTLAACGDARLDKLHIGDTADAAAISVGLPPHRTVTYFAKGHQWMVQFYPKAETGDKDSVEWRKMSPVVLIDSKVVGWGWNWWGPEAAKEKIAMPADK